MKRQQHGARAGAWYLLIAAVSALVVTACGSTAAPAGGAAAGSSPASGGTSPQAARIALSVSVSHGPGTPVRHWTLRCDPAGGTNPDPARACRVLMHARDPFGPLPRGIMCPMIMAGTKVATVYGTWYGKPIHVTMIQGGCWLPRWGEVGQIFN